MDVDSLPSNEVSCPILKADVAREMSLAGIVTRVFGPRTVERVVRMVDRAEFKRRQSAPGPKVTDRAFGCERRMPFTKP